MNKLQMKLYAKQFGLFFSTKAYIYQQMVNRSKGDRKIQWADKLNNYKLDKLDQEFSEFIMQEAERWRENKLESCVNKTVWTFWYQGNHSEIPMVNMCLNSVRNNVPEGSRMIVLTKENLPEYLVLPDYITQKVSEGVISLTHLSDIIRVSLLSKWGGCWLDATVFALRPFPYVFEGDFWTTKRTANNVYISKGRWTGFSMSGKSHCILFDLMTKLFYEYWKRYDVLIDFFLIDLFLELLYRKVPEVRSLIDKVQPNNIGVHELWARISLIYNEQDFDSFTRNADLYKLSWRTKVHSTINNELTVYGKIRYEQERQ